MKNFIILLLSLFTGAFIMAQDAIPDVFNNIYYDQDNKLYHQYKGKNHYVVDDSTTLTLSNMQGNPVATSTGLEFNFNDPKLSGKLYYGLINFKDSKHPTPVWYKVTSKINKGKAKINILKRLSGRYDMTSWRKSGAGTLGYRISNEKFKAPMLLCNEDNLCSNSFCFSINSLNSFFVLFNVSILELDTKTFSLKLFTRS